MENKPEDNFPENTSKYWQYGNKVGKKPNQFRIFPTNLKVRNKKENPDKRKTKRKWNRLVSEKISFDNSKIPEVFGKISCLSKELYFESEAIVNKGERKRRG